MLSEAKIILPKLDNDSNDLTIEREHILSRILATFGGYNIVPSFGAWKNPFTGIVYHDEVFTVTVAGDWKDILAVNQFKRLAELACQICRQESIYLNINGEVHFVEYATEYSIAA